MTLMPEVAHTKFEFDNTYIDKVLVRFLIINKILLTNTDYYK